MSSFVRKLRQVLLGNLPYKILSVLIALALWFIVRDERIETSLSIALEVQPAADLVVSNESLPDLTVGVNGTRAALSRLRSAGLVHVVTPGSTEPGNVTVRIRPEDLELPPGISVVHVSPATASVRLEARSVRRVPVKPRLLVAEGTGWRVRRVAVTPERVRITGPASVVATLDEVWTEAIEVSRRGPDPVIGEYAVSLPHKQLRLEQPGPVTVKIELEEQPADPVPSPTPTTPAGIKVNGKLPVSPEPRTARK